MLDMERLLKKFMRYIPLSRVCGRENIQFLIHRKERRQKNDFEKDF